jgi:hypothetical protein
MSPTRRTLLQTVGAVSVSALAGCSTTDLIGGDDPSRTYTLDIDRIEATPTNYALYEPDDGALFGDPGRAALDRILPDGRYTTYGYEPLPDDAYVAYDGSFYQTEQIVTGRKELSRTLVRVESVPSEEVPESATLLDTLEQPSARVLKILHSYTQTGGETSSAELLRDDAYVLRRPIELESRLATGALDGQVVTMTESGAWAYRVHVSRERIVETEYTAVAIEVAESRAEFRDVVFASRIDAELTEDALAAGVRDLLEQAIERGRHAETTPLSTDFETLLDALGLGDVDRVANGRLLWYDDALFRYGLYINEMNE